MILAKKKEKILGNKYLRATVSIVLLYLAFRKISSKTYFANIFSFKFLASVLFLALSTNLVTLLMSYRWKLIFFPKSFSEKLNLFFKATYNGLFYNMLLPTSIGGDLIKWIPLRSLKIKKSVLLTSVLVDRFIGLSASVLVAFFSSILTIVTQIYQPPSILFISLSTFSFLFLLFLSGGITDTIKKVIPLPLKIKKLLSYIQRKQTVIKKMTMLSIISQFIVCLSYVVLGFIWNVGYKMLYIFVFMPFIAIFLILPISVGGFGATEAVFLFFFEKVGINKELILTITTTVAVNKILMALEGWLLNNNLITTYRFPERLSPKPTGNF